MEDEGKEEISERKILLIPLDFQMMGVKESSEESLVARLVLCATRHTQIEYDAE